MTVRIARIETWLVSVLLFSVLLCASAARAQQKPEQLAEQSANTWLALVDSGKYGESWDGAAQFFKAAVTREQWVGMLQSTRAPLGKLVSRSIKSATFTKTLPGAPDGQYVAIQYDTSFEHKQSAIETVTPKLDKDGQWRVSGYFIK